MNVYALVHNRIRASLEALEKDGVLPAGLDQSAVEVTAPRDSTHGDLASNVALVLAKPAKANPRAIAEKIAAELHKAPEIDKVEIAGPGFINIALKPHVWHAVVGAVLREREGYGRVDLGHGEKVDIEFVSANPTGPMHVGHCRGAVFGDALANLLEFTGYAVTREYYINDAGAQVEALGRSAFLRYREALGEDIGPIPEGLYPGDYLVPVGQALAREHGRALLNLPQDRRQPLVRDFAVAAMLESIKQDLAALDVRHSVFFSERDLMRHRDRIKEAIAELERKGLIYRGRLPKPKAHDDSEWEDREQLLFKSTDFGDDVDRALEKADGSYTYFAADMAYHNDKLKRGFRNLINVFGADHAGYIKRVRATVKALSDGKANLDVKVCQLVKLFRAGQPVKMSKRAGTFVTLREVVDEVGRDPVRFMMLYRKNDAPLDFDLAKVMEQSKDNPVFYVQYAHARGASVFRQVNDIFPDFSPGSPHVLNADLSQLTDAGELDLIRRLAAFPKLVEGASVAHEPHRVAFYLYDLASTFHSQWTKGNEMPHLRFIQPDNGTLTAARLALIGASTQVLASGLAILGVHAPDEMR
jgi:arginyl-tRNA synthetase